MVYDCTTMSRQGKKSFENCQVKSVTTQPVPGDRSYVRVQLNCPRTEEVGQPLMSGKVYAASEGGRQLGRMAAGQLCGNCAFAGMSRAEVMSVLHDEAAQKVARLALQVEAAQMQATLDQLTSGHPPELPAAEG